MEWQGTGAILSTRLHGESAAIIEVFTETQGRHAGLVRGGASRKMAAHLQAGTQVSVTWRARLGEHMGTYTVEPIRARAGILADPLALAGLNAVCALSQLALPEREPQGAFWGQTMALLDAMDKGIDAGITGAADWAPDYLRWELELLQTLGFGLDLTSCAVTGGREDLAYVSPKSGRAVGRDAAGDWAARLLPLPPVLLGQGPANGPEIAQGLTLTGFFLNRGLAPILGNKPLPAARGRLLAVLARRASQIE